MSLRRISMVHAAGHDLDHTWTAPFRQALEQLGSLTVVEQVHELDEDAFADLLRRHEVVLVGWGSQPLPVALAEDPGEVRYLCGYTGSMQLHVPAELLDAGMLLTNWGDLPADGVAEGAMALLLALLKELPATIEDVRTGGWNSPGRRRGHLTGARVGLYGCGAIGRRFCELLAPYRADVAIFDPYASELPAGTRRVNSLEALFDHADIVVLHAGLTDETAGSVTAELLERLPDGGIVVNTARGGLIDQRALFAELETGRLRAGLDVVRPDWADTFGPPWLGADHPARRWTNLVLSGHTIEQREWPPRPPDALEPIHEYCLENLRRYAAGEPVRFVMDRTRYDRSS